MRRKVVLYNPKAVFHTMPLALVAIGSGFDPQRYDLRIVDGRLERDPLAALQREVNGAVCLGISVLTGAPILDALRASRMTKATHPEVPVVWGGWHPSLFPTDTLAEPSVDITVAGQGEETFGELVQRLAEGEELAGLKGICFRSGEEVVTNPPRPLIDMNELPAHDYDLVPVERYFEAKGQRQLDYISSTGCYFRCAFCADPFVFKRGWVALTPERMGEEIERHWRRYQFTELAFQDETFFTYDKRVEAIAEEFLGRNLRFAWTATMRADQGARLNEATFELCVRSGLRRLMIGVESGSQEMLDWMKKDITLEQVLECAEICVRHGVGAIFPFIVGFPDEREAGVRATLGLAKRLRSLSPSFETPIFYFKPYPGSAITQDMVAKGYQLPDSLKSWADFDFIGSSGPWVTEELERYVERFKFYNRFAGGPESWLRWPLQQLARWRCRRDCYSLP
ncbi:MAG: B12-binding domain-containing radical SAM protein, partial [Acidobacteriota bacterium]